MDKAIEDKWIKRWDEKKVFEPEVDESRDKKLVTFPFPYMNGPLHLGHAFTATRVDVYARYKRMQGLNTLFPWAWHWTGQPIVAAAERLRNGDPAMIREFVEIDKVPKDELAKFYDPKYMAQYYTASGKVALKHLALSIDWRREFHTTDLEPTFNKFVLWQYETLRLMGYVTKGTHPVVWCPHDQSPTGDHDRIEGQGVQWEEYTLVLFELEGSKVYLPAATFRPETLFGVTNLWINPYVEYSETLVDEKQRWIVSPQAADKLKDQLHKVEVLRRISGKDLVGRNVLNPLKPEKQIMILPAQFVDPENGTGVVYSVPAHAPMDYIALRDVQSNRQLQEKFGLDFEKVSAIVPISLISVPGMGEFPAEELVVQMKIRDQSDPEVTEATSEVYKREFHQGVLNQNTGKYSGKKVAEAKPLVIEELKKRGLADSMYDLPERVVCRCLTVCRVKILEDQWFLKYSDPAWKKAAHDCIDQCQIYPETARQWFHDVIDWIKDWPCARRVGLGTPLPWSPGWIVETLSDSTIYMAFYTIKPLIDSSGISPESLSQELFDYVYRGKGTAESAARESSGVDPALIERMRTEFLYWYPVNLRNSAKELIPNHLTFFVFQHVAFFPKDLWPTGISANGMMTVEGEKMSKSKGNVITLSNALEQYGADAVRSALVDGAEGLEDMDWREKNAKDILAKVNSLPNFILSLRSPSKASAVVEGIPDLWLENQIQVHIANISRNLDEMKTKSAFQEAFYSFWNDLKYYLSRTDKRNLAVVEYAIQNWIKLLAPFMPYAVEEINEAAGGKGLVCESSFPAVDGSKLHPEAELYESLIERLVEDSMNILKLMPQQPKSLHVYVAPGWLFELFSELATARGKNEKTSETIQRFFSSHPNLDKKIVANSLNSVSKTINELGDSFLENFKKSNFGGIEEGRAYKDSAAYLGRRLGVTVTVHEASDVKKYDPKNKSAIALPFKPALYFE